MRIETLSPQHHAEFLRLVDAEIRPNRAKSHAWEDFPVILGEQNRPWTLGVVEEDGALAAGLACLVRVFQTTCGEMPVAGLGSVVTRPDRRGRGYSSALQNAMLDKLRGKNVPLAVLWTDQPEIYAGRGFTAAGWEWHVDLAGARLPGDLPPGFRRRPYEPRDADAVAALYRRHALRTLRLPGEPAALYGMPGTRGHVACGDDGAVAAAVFCGKGADFPGYVAEWAGPVGLVAALLGAARGEGLADHVLAPPGGERLVDHLTGLGAAWFCQTSGLWNVLQPDKLAEYLTATRHDVPSDPASAVAMLGGVTEDGQPLPGALTVAVWGFDSV